MDTRLTVLVTGATGYIGRHIVQAMNEQGHRVRALARDEQRLAPIRDACDEVFIGSATRMETLDGLCDGVDVVISSLGLRTLRTNPSPEEVDLRANLNVLRRAEEASVQQFVFVGVLRGDELARSVPILAPREEFTRQLKNSGLTWTVLRPTGSFNDMKEIFRIAQRGWSVILGSGHYRINPVHPADIADAATRAIADASLHNAELGFGGPDTFTQREIGELASHVLERRLRTVRIPLWPVDAAVSILRPFNRNAAGFLKFFRYSLSRDMAGSAIGTRRLADFYRTLDRGRDRHSWGANG